MSVPDNHLIWPGAPFHEWIGEDGRLHAVSWTAAGGRLSDPPARCGAKVTTPHANFGSSPGRGIVRVFSGDAVRTRIEHLTYTIDPCVECVATKGT